MTSTPTLVFSPGDVVAGKYEVIRQLGEGGMGVVVAARHRDLDTPVAIKVVRPEYAANEEIVARMLVEARSAAKIRSEHVCKVLDVGRLESGAPYIVMEHLDGVDLGQLLAQHGKLPLVTVIDYVLQACEALAEAHAAEIVHRDLKPENLFLAHRADGSALVKVLDFGISKSLKTDDRASALTSAASAVGSPFYMSPEQMMSSRDVDARTDLWALGVIVHELLTGTPPFYADTLPGVCAKVLNQPTPPLRVSLPDMPEALELVLLKCTMKNREERYASVSDVARALAPFGSSAARTSAERVARVLGEAPLAVSPATPTERDEERAQRLAPMAATVAATAPGLAHPTGSLTIPQRSSSALLLASLGFVGLLGASAWWFLGRATPTTSPEAAPVAVAPAAPLPSSPARAADEPKVTAVQVLPAGDAPLPPASATSTAKAPQKALPNAVTRPASKRGAAKPAGDDAYNPDAFGGRR